MKTKELKKFKLPSEPGVYFFHGGRGKIIYIGKATNLNSRVKSYFAVDLDKRRGGKIVEMVNEAKKITFEKTDNVLEALVLEAYLIKKHQPRYNTRDKDNKSFTKVIVTDEDFPRVLLVRERELLTNPVKYKIKYEFGPFTSGTLLKSALKIIRKIFPYRENCQPNSGRACFNAQLGLCPGVCKGEISKTEYRKNIRNIVLFFEGKKGKIKTLLTSEMKKLAKEQKFEKADEIKRQIFALDHINDVSLMSEEFSGTVNPESTKRIESYDIAHTMGREMVGVMVVMNKNGFDKSAYRKFKIKGFNSSNDTGALIEVLERRANHTNWSFPTLVVVDGGVAQLNAVKKILKIKNWQVPVVSVVKDEKHKAREILGEIPDDVTKADILRINNEAHRFAIEYHRMRMRGRLK